MKIAGCSAIVTGGASGIGAATVRALAVRGVRCVVLDRNEGLGRELAYQVDGVFCAGDVSKEDDVAAAVAAAVDGGPLRVLVNAAGIPTGARTLDRAGCALPLGKFERVLQVNLLGAFNCIRLFAEAVARTEPVDDDGQRGVVVNVSSVAAFEGQIGQAAYAASKAGIVGMTLPIARDLSSIGVRVNTVAPGLIDTPAYGQGGDAEAFKAKLGANVLFPKRMGTTDELASVVIELITNDYLNGETVRVDAGIRMPPK